MKLIFDKSIPSRRALRFDGEKPCQIDRSLLRKTPANLPEVSELDVMRHFTELSGKNFGVDNGFYPLGSCTMKYNPKFTEQVARLDSFASLHPMLAQIPGGAELAQGALAVLSETERYLAEICGMAAVTNQPMAGANGELTGALLIAAYHRKKGNTHKRTILIPDSAHGTNPASAALAGFDVQTIASDSAGVMNLQAVKDAICETTAGIMLTCPNTLGIFNPHVKEICDAIHSVDGLAYYDGANLNAILGRCRPGDLGFDIIHVNLHKTFATPHGGGGPGSGPVGVCKKLAEFLPVPIITHIGGRYALDYDRSSSIGMIAPYYGSFGIILRAYAYMIRLGSDGMRRVSLHAVLNANYIRTKLLPYYDIAFPGICKHECVFSAARQMKAGVSAMDIAKSLIDRGFHPPTVYFPLTVSEAMMIEPTETESLETLDTFIDAMIDIAKQVDENPQSFANLPLTTPVGRLDETLAARKPDVAVINTSR